MRNHQQYGLIELILYMIQTKLAISPFHIARLHRLRRLILMERRKSDQIMGENILDKILRMHNSDFFVFSSFVQHTIFLTIAQQFKTLQKEDLREN